jgi:nitronate monooxygenase
VLRVPFLCSGGVGDGRQLAAALALGADGVNCGTRFCATRECNWPVSFKQRMVAASEADTVLMFRTLHNTARVFRNAVAAEVEQVWNRGTCPSSSVTGAPPGLKKYYPVLNPCAESA